MLIYKFIVALDLSAAASVAANFRQCLTSLFDRSGTDLSKSLFSMSHILKCLLNHRCILIALVDSQPALFLSVPLSLSFSSFCYSFPVAQTRILEAGLRWSAAIPRVEDFFEQAGLLVMEAILIIINIRELLSQLSFFQLPHAT